MNPHAPHATHTGTHSVLVIPYAHASGAQLGQDRLIWSYLIVSVVIPYPSFISCAHMRRGKCKIRFKLVIINKERRELLLYIYSASWDQPMYTYSGAPTHHGRRRGTLCIPNANPQYVTGRKTHTHTHTHIFIQVWVLTDYNKSDYSNYKKYCKNCSPF